MQGFRIMASAIALLGATFVVAAAAQGSPSKASTGVTSSWAAAPAGKTTAVTAQLRPLSKAALPGALATARRHGFRAQASSLTLPCSILGSVERTRTYACVNGATVYRVREARTRAIVGTAILAVIERRALNPKSRTWRMRFTIIPLLTTGIVSGDLNLLSVVTACHGGCSARVTGKKFVAFNAINRGVPQTITDTITSGGKLTNHTTQIPVLLGTTLGSANLAATPLIPMQARCDSIRRLGKPGCVDAGVIPTYTISRAEFPNVAGHIANAQQTLVEHWGWEGHGPALHRTFSQAIIDANRNKACPSGKYPEGSCDEYPFASTREGAAHNPNAVEGVDYSTAEIPTVTENRNAGIDLNTKFYQLYRINDGDAFWVDVGP